MFHRDKPVCAKARTPHDDNVARGTSSCPRFAERRFWRPGRLDAWWHIVDKYAMQNPEPGFALGKCHQFSRAKKMADISKDGLLLGGGIRHITATQAEVKKFLLAYVILF